MRRQKRLSLQAVEKASSLEFKASVLGAYERASGRSRSRGCSAWPGCTACRWTSCCRPTGASRRARAAGAGLPHANGERPDPEGKPFKVVVDLLRLSEVQGPERELLRRFLASVQVQRQDFNGEVLTIRSEDLRVMASMLGQSLATLLKRLEELGVLRG